MAKARTVKTTIVRDKEGPARIGARCNGIEDQRLLLRPRAANWEGRSLTVRKLAEISDVEVVFVRGTGHKLDISGTCMCAGRFAVTDTIGGPHALWSGDGRGERWGGTMTDRGETLEHRNKLALVSLYSGIVPGHWRSSACS
jgi:hypothetical protein